MGIQPVVYLAILLQLSLLISLHNQSPQKVALKKSKSCAKLVAEVAQKVALKLRAIWLIFGRKMLLWPFGTSPNFGNEQQNNIYRYYIGLMKCKSQISLEKSLCSRQPQVILKTTLQRHQSSHSSPMTSRVKRSMEARSCKFRTYSYKLRKGMITGAQRSNLPPNFPKWKIISAKQPEICQSCAKVALRGKNCAVARKRKSCAPQHRNFLVGLPNNRGYILAIVREKV